jgi:hypothetical protein
MTSERAKEMEAMTPEEYQALIDRLDNPPLSWVPQSEIPGGMADLDPAKLVRDAQVFGQVDEIDDSRVSDFGSYRVVVIERPDSSRVAIFALGMVLDKRMAGVKVGDKIAVKYLGTKPSRTPGQADYHDYNVAVDRA